MYKVLIVDDEVLVRVGLKTTIDWEANGFTVAAEASNGEQGYEQYLKHQPDVIITDIKMPKRDGLWLVEKVRKENSDTKILVLTCYDEFSYARKALKLGADDYILKSEVEDEELVAVMQSVKKKLDELNKKRHIQVKELMNINDVKRSIFVDMIKSDFCIDSNLSERCSSVEFPLVGTGFVFASISIGRNNGKAQPDASMLKQTYNAVLNFLFDSFKERSIEYIFMHQTREYVFFLSSQKFGGFDPDSLFRTIASSVRQYFDISINIVFTDSFSDIKESAAVYKNFTEKAQVLFYIDNGAPFVSKVDSISFAEPNVFSLKKEYNRKFVEAIGQEDTHRTEELIHETGRYFKQNNVNPMIVKIFYSGLMGEIFSSYGLFLENNMEFSNHEYYHCRIMNSEHLQNIISLLVDFTGKVIYEIRHIRHTNSKAFINQAITYIHNHYDKKISLEDVARNLHLSKHYLCNAFKKATGENMSLYINKLRIEKAKRLLLESDSSAKEICEEVGYSNQQYFSKVFKRITGMTVVEYKESRPLQN